MKKLKEYIFTNLSSTFYPIFFTLFSITSIVFLVKIASLTSIITIDFIELFKLYIFRLPDILFLTLPISFFASSVITIAKLSNEYELIVITSFGLNPIEILKIMLKPIILLTIVLLIISLELQPKANHLNKIFLNQKKKEANFNIKASEFGQKFGDWMIYIDDDSNNEFKNIKLFRNEKNKELILARKAKISNNKGNLSLVLDDGKSFIISKDEINQINFKQMNINDSLKNSKSKDFKNSYLYWIKYVGKDKRVTKKFVFAILVSFFPLLSIFLITSFSFFNPRYDKNRSVAFSTFFILLFYILAYYSAKSLLLTSLLIIPSFWFISSYLIYYFRIKRVY